MDVLNKPPGFYQAGLLRTVLHIEVNFSPLGNLKTTPQAMGQRP
ncbi:MAG: hypothetical protein ACJ0RQ_14235 [Candidatus Azotimanducaceae bacterium]